MTTNHTEEETMRDNKRGTIEDRSVDALLEPGVIKRVEPRSEREARLYVRVSELEGVLERLLVRLSEAKDLADVNIAAGTTLQDLSHAG